MSKPRTKWHNRLVQGDCLDALRGLPDGLVDLIYIDPPFLTGRDHGKGKHSFADKWQGGLPQFTNWLMQRVTQMHRVLAATGAFYIHLDWRTSHYVKVRCDELFGPENFRNEIHWRRDVAGKGAKGVAGQWPRNADNILVYSRGPKWHFTQPRTALTATQAKNYRYCEPDGRRFKTVMLGDYSAASIARMEKQGLIYVSASGKKYKKYYLDQASATVDTLWIDIPGFGTRTSAKERIGYPTQKPEALLERIMEASSRPGDLVADFFMGSGTTCAVAQRLGRRWLGVDESADAVKLAAKRLSALGAEFDAG